MADPDYLNARNNLQKFITGGDLEYLSYWKFIGNGESGLSVKCCDMAHLE